MAIFNLFNGKKKEEEKKADPKAAKAAEKGTSAKTAIKVAPAKAPAGLVVQPEPTAKKTTAKSTSKATEKAPAAKTAPAKSSSAKATTKTGVTKAPEKKAAPAKAPAKKTAAAKPAAKTSAKTAPATKKAAPAKAETPKPIYYTTARPFQQATEEDIRLAFDHAIGEAEKEILRNGIKAVGKYEFSLEVDGYHFYLIANNGQILFESPSFTSMLGALNGLNTFKRTVASEEFDIKVDKYNRYRFILANKYYGENYTTREQCQRCAESVRNFANNAHIIRFTPTKEELHTFELARITKKTADDIDWNAIAKAEANAPKKGKFEICREQDEFCFYLLASNGQILYSSRFYASESACRKGIESFKRAAYVGNFFVDRDKFGHYRYVLKNIGSAPAFIGESYDNKPQCENIIQSVKNFIVTASIEMDDSSN
jgi:uncharacterized protein YegP (UPF0339 family)